MSKSEQEIKNRLSQAKSMEGVDSAALWGAISDASLSANAANKKRYIAYWISGVAVVSAILWFTFSTNAVLTSDYSPRVKRNSQLASIKSDTNYSHELRSEKVYEQNLDSISEALQREKETNLSELENSNPAEQKKSISTLSDFDADNQQNSDGFLISEKVFSSQLSEIDRSAFEKLNQTSEPDTELLGVIPKKVDPSKMVSETTNLDGLTEARTEEYIALTRLNVINTMFPGVPSAELNFGSPVFSTPKLRLPISIYGGSTLVKSTYRSTNEGLGLADSLNTNITSRMGYRMGASYRVKKGNNWNLKLGLEFSKWNDRLDKVLISDTMIFEEPNSSELIPAINVRTVKHHNRLTVLSIPLELELYKDIENFRFGIGLGASYSFVFGQEGRGLQDHYTIIDYSKSNKRYSNFISLRTNPSIGYKLSEKVMLNAMCTFGYQTHSSAEFNDLKSNSILAMPALGVSLHY